MRKVLITLWCIAMIIFTAVANIGNSTATKQGMALRCPETWRPSPQDQPIVRSWPVEHHFYDMKGRIRQIREFVIERGLRRLNWEEVYDKQGRITSRTRYDSSGMLDTLTIRYEPNDSRCETTISSAWKWVRVYDANARLLSETAYRIDANGTELLNEQNTHRYDAVGHEIETTSLHSYESASDKQTLTSHDIRSFDAQGKLCRVIRSQNGERMTTDYTYNPNGHLTRTKTVDDDGKLVEESRRQYDGANRLVSYELLNATGDRLRAAKYEYNASGLLVSYEEYAWNYDAINVQNRSLRIIVPATEQIGDAPLRLRIVGEYDAKGRLIAVAAYDGEGQACLQTLEHFSNLVGFPVPGIFFSSWIGPVFTRATVQYSNDGTPDWTAYDLSGKKVEDYSPWGRHLKPVVAPQTITPPAKPTFTYDGHGNWIRSVCGDYVTEREISYYR